VLSICYVCGELARASMLQEGESNTMVHSYPIVVHPIVPCVVVVCLFSTTLKHGKERANL